LPTNTIRSEERRVLFRSRYTNNNAWQFFNPGDTSMNRVSFIETINYAFGKTG